jgi:hypothetical protein
MFGFNISSPELRRLVRRATAPLPLTTDTCNYFLTCALPFSLLGFQLGMRNQKVPDHGLERLGMRVTFSGLTVGTCSKRQPLGSVSAVSSHDSRIMPQLLWRIAEQTPGLD